MFYEARIKVESAFLGNKSLSGTMVFVRDKNGGLVIPVDQWEWAVAEACASLHLTGVEPKCFLPPVPIYIPTTALYSRNYTREGMKKESCMHESVRKGAELSIDMVVSSTPTPRSSLDKNLETLDSKQIEQILKFIGRFLGLSPFGSEKGYGRFSLLELKTKIPTL